MKDYSGEKWMRENKYQWMNDNQFECYKMLCDLFGGNHHVFDLVKPSNIDGISINKEYCNLGTYDFNYLTRAVLMAHDRNIRFEVSPGGARKLHLTFHKRNLREGDMSEKHPTIEMAIESYNQDKK
jgi:hypothetical protein